MVRPQEIEHNGIKFWCYNAGHILGAAMFMIEIGGVKVLYTGDYSTEDDRHLMAAEHPSHSPDVLIVESTYGIQRHDRREDREQRFTNAVESIVSRGGKCLIPVFALGRAQELLLILDEYWAAHPHLHEQPIYFSSKLASRALRVYQTYINMMNHHIRQVMDYANPFNFKFVRNIHGRGADGDVLLADGGMVVFASPGMLQSGKSRELFDAWCHDKRNGVIIAGYAVEGTLAKHIATEPSEITGADGRVRERNCQVELISFSAHVDYAQNYEFIRSVTPLNVVLVHGEKNEMGRLKNQLEQEVRKWPEERRPTISAPDNQQPVEIPFRRDKRARALGALGDAASGADAGEGDAKDDGAISGVLVSKDLSYTVMAPRELPTYTDIVLASLRQRVHVRARGVTDATMLRRLAEQVFADVELTDGSAAAAERGEDDDAPAGGDPTGGGVPEGAQTVIVCRGAVTCMVAPMGDTAGGCAITLEWETSPLHDMIADAIVALVSHAESSPAALAAAARPCCGKSRASDRCCGR